MSANTYTLSQGRKSFGDGAIDADFNPQFSYFKSHEKKSTTLEFKNIGFSIKEKTILKDVTGHVKGGEVCALMGPSGAGKSSLLNILAGRVVQDKKKKLEGDVFVNGSKISPIKFRRHIAYVMQDDLMFSSATVRESLEFSAKLRLTKAVAGEPDQLNKIVDDLLESLGLSHVSDSVVGSVTLRGISGGERKRVAIGVELVTNPNLLFLDEPTSGLDSFNAWKVVKILQNLARATGCAVLCTIHQPSSEVFNEFENIIMLSKGNVVYNGKVYQLPNIMARLGRPIPHLTNPADFLMLVVQKTDPDDLFSFNIDTAEWKPKVNISDLEIEFSSFLNRSENKIGDKIALEHTEADVSEEDKAGFMTQVKLLTKRELKHLYRDPTFVKLIVVSRTVVNLVIGSVFYQTVTRGDDFIITVALSSVIFTMFGVFMASLQPQLLNFPLDRGIMIREYQVGTYGSTPYLLSKLFVEIPQALVASAITYGVLYPLMGLTGNFFLFLLLGTIVGAASGGLGQFVGAAVKDAKSAQEFGPLVLFPQILFSGLFIPLNSVPVFLRWIQYVSLIKYGVNLAALIEFDDCGDFIELARLQAQAGECDDNSTSCVDLQEELEFKESCLLSLEQQDIQRDQWAVYLLILLALALGFRLTSLLLLLYRAKFYTD